MKKRTIYIIVSLFLLVGIFFAVKTIRYEHYPVSVEPSETWEPYVNSLDAQREAFFFESDGIKLEAELFIPNGGSEKKPAVVFAPGSGDSLYQNYAKDFVETYILDFFLSHDFVVLLVNKRGMGQSEGNYVKNSIEGRAVDVYAAVQSIRTNPQIDAGDIGLIGHSQGGWVVTHAAALHPDIAFFINLAGSTMTIAEQASDMFYHEAICTGYEGDEIDAYVDRRDKLAEIGVKLGKLTNFGMWGFDARNRSYDPRNALLTVKSPGLYVFSENDHLVSPGINIERMEEIFDGVVPPYLNMVVIDNATHRFRLVNDPCEIWHNSNGLEQSKQLTDVLDAWLAEQGY